MITFRFSGRTPTPNTYQIGQETDQNAEKLRFILPQIADGQSAQLLMLLPDKTPEALNIVNGMATVSSAMTEQPGRITAWVEILGGDTIAWNSELIYLDVGDLPPISEETERKYPTAIQDALDAETRAREYYGAVEELAGLLQQVRDAFALIQHMHIDDTAMPEGGTAGQFLEKKSATNYDAQWKSFSDASQSAAGMMSASDKTKLDGLPSGAATQSDMGLMSAADKTKLDGLDKSNYLGRNTGYVYQAEPGGNANDYLTEFHGFVFNMTNTPDNHGFLDVSYFDGSQFAPAATGVWRQMFTHFSSGDVYIRMKLGTGGSWSDWRRLMDNTDLVRERYTITFTSAAVGEATGIPSQTFSKTAYKPIMFSIVPGTYMDHGGLNCDEITISNNTVNTGIINFTTLDSGGAGQTCELYIDVLYVPI